MALCADVALVSLGMSCQGAIQLQVHRALVAEIVGSAPVIKRTPFDWLICPPATAATMIATDRYYPQRAAELECRPDAPPRWPAVGDCYFWDEPKNVASYPDSFTAKFAHISQTLRGVAGFTRRIFFVANTQDNLADEVQAVAAIPYIFTDEAIDRLAAAVSQRFGGDLYVVSTPTRHELMAPANLDRLLLMDVTPGIRGSDSDWSAAFRTMLRRSMT
ncbi:MAG: hypothetical protein VYA67_06465 [Actinomycetota bacterium]|uniref:Papain-like cysteine peptidase n=1 Tax=Mycobacterium lentiflavum TaxID=141349 RepID=A0ABY3UV11_MYCLN|nr:hypothetical protein [Mycobacterium lentiflavum]MEE3063597.1 hypothetical protein [Actinomycetota bacterium]ULP42423.1 hypothetical protein MJO58_27250 [Mycobacterium lentiflavum]